MTKVILGLILISNFVFAGYAYLTGSQTNGMNKICFYSDGTAINVSASSNCPVTKD